MGVIRLLIVIFVFFPCYANASGMWILWTKSTLIFLDKTEEKNWKVGPIFNDKDQCIKELKSQANNAIDGWQCIRKKDGSRAAMTETNFTETSGVALILVGDPGRGGLSLMYEYRCLPDTIDPR